LTDSISCDSIIDQIRPDEIYNFAGISDVFDPFDNLELLYKVNCNLPCNILSSIVKFDKSIKFFQSSSRLVFGRSEFGVINELGRREPQYPYGATKLFVDNMINEFRIKYNLFACSGIFFNHESPRRKDKFFTKKIINGVVDISLGKRKKILVGDLYRYVDMGYAKEFMEAVYLMMQSSKPRDYVIGTGHLTFLEEFVSMVFSEFGMDWKEHIEYDERFKRISDGSKKADITKIKLDLGWEPKYKVKDLIKEMLK